MPPKPTFFPTPADFRAWFEAHHDKFHELFVGFHKKNSGKPSITWPESVEVALCFGWIDGVRKSLDETSYTIRFTPRKPTGTWSSININLVRKLTKQRLMYPAGLKAFAARSERKSSIYSYEQRKNPRFTREQEKQFRANKPAWEFFRSQAPWYQRVTTYWVISAKREDTKLKRLSELIEYSQNHKILPRNTPTKKK
ncbi:MAG TPA: YdeI/OmpD-associated family protein [Candidatus Acidoferrales bacterium]|nr:YdeI/OmpD-associated family protein [Candidatus Acidoferrales bacterium]